MFFDEITTRAVMAALASGIPFVAFVRPRDNRLTFFSDPDSNSEIRSDTRFAVNQWCGGSGCESVIYDRADALQTIDDACRVGKTVIDMPEAWRQSTSRAEYDMAMDQILEHLQNHGGKVVLSRTIADMDSSVDWVNVAERYFTLHDEAFRYLYFTPRYGCWLGASPEQLLIVNGADFSTMALAGTREGTDAAKLWSGKNIAEQAIVRNYIVDRLYDLGLAPQCAPTETITTGNIQHLCTIVSGSIQSADPADILRALNPTPALAGYPLPLALEQIAMNERHPRRCYGGYIAVATKSSMEAYVNLRCVNFDDNGWCMYVGGGIMPDSDVDEEWKETESKARILKKLIGDSQK